MLVIDTPFGIHLLRIHYVFLTGSSASLLSTPRQLSHLLVTSSCNLTEFGSSKRL